MKTNTSILKAAVKRLTVLLVFAGLTVGAFATLGENNFGKEKPKKSSLLSNKNNPSTGVFSLESGYSFRGNQVINLSRQSAINLSNTVVTYQQGNITYTIPANKKVILNNRITFNPNAKTRN